MVGVRVVCLSPMTPRTTTTTEGSDFTHGVVSILVAGNHALANFKAKVTASIPGMSRLPGWVFGRDGVVVEPWGVCVELEGVGLW